MLHLTEGWSGIIYQSHIGPFIRYDSEIRILNELRKTVVPIVSIVNHQHKNIEIMKSLVVYSSRTGNTKKVAKAIFDILPDMKILSTVEHAPSPEDFDLIALGFWIDRGYPDADAQRYMQTLRGKKIGVFGTLGTYHDIDYVVTCQKRARENLQGNTILGTFFCQGKVAPGVVELISRTNRMTTGQRERIEEAHEHPDAEDLFNAQEVFRDIMTKLPM